MFVKLVSSTDIIHKEILKIIELDVKRAFKEKYEINDSLWFVPKLSSNKVTGLNAKVVNTAEYISKRFQNELEECGWTPEKELDDQRIDAYKEFEYSGKYLGLNKDEFLEVVRYLDVEDSSYPEKVSMLYKSFYKTKFPYNHEYFTGKLQNIGKPKEFKRKIKLGLEFETGNIASSFRALAKLNHLFDNGYIDIGVFITSLDKDTSTRIWPSSNRNGSIEELNNRKAFAQTNLPLVVFGFRPEKYSTTAKYLSKNGKYEIEMSDEYFEYKGNSYRWDTSKTQMKKQ